jgi:sugar lactone lactonase YvrE
MSRDCRAELVEIISVGNTLGEGISWDTMEERLWWTDIQERCLYRFDPRTSSLGRYEVPERLCSFGFVENSDLLIAAFESGFALYHPGSSHLEWIARLRHDAVNVRLNDGRVDRQGRFWAGSMTEGHSEPRGKLYCLDGARLQVHLTDIAISNSICFSPDGRHLYFADTPRRMIQRYDLDATRGVLSNPVTFVRTPEGAFPDGSSVDAAGHVWNAHWNAGRVVRYAPDGSISGEICIPTSQPTCVAFGGRELDLLFVTSARDGLTAKSLRREPRAGDVFVYRLDVKGLPDTRYVPPRPDSH